MEEREKPLLKVAIFSDIQGYAAEYDWGMHNTEMAFRLLAPMQPDVLMMGGDLADWERKDAFAYYRRLVETYFAGKVPVSVACAGNHDYGMPGIPRGTRPWVDELYRKFAADLGQSPENPFHVVVGGYDFIAMSEDITLPKPAGHHSAQIIAALKAELDKAVARDGEKPIFVITHYLPRFTVPGSFHEYGIPELRELFDGYPQVLSFSSHVHVPLEDERNIWQGGFTAVQTGTLSYACMGEANAFNCCNGIVPFAREAVQCMFMEIFSDHLEIRRYNVEDQREIMPGNRWRVEIPYRPESAKYTDAREASTPVPEFAPGTKALLRYDYGYLYLLFEEARCGEVPAEYYRIRLSGIGADGTAVFRGEKNYVSNFYRLARNRDPRQVFQLCGDDLPPYGGMVRAEIFPLNSYMRAGKPLTVEFINPCEAAKTGPLLRPQE